MPSAHAALLGPFLELSTENLHLDDLTVDQLAALWNVFTKVGDSLHKGRRLENFVWRAWHREAHLLPQDASWSDFADCTPLETPALSRTGSVSYSHSFQRRPTVPATSASAWATADVVSDPESGSDWSSASEDEEDAEQTATKATLAHDKDRASSSNPSLQASSSSRQPDDQNTSPSERGRSQQKAVQSASSQGPNNTVLPQAVSRLAQESSESPIDRRRAVSSSSSAFGSKARVRHLNRQKINRRSPISLQTALGNLASNRESDDLAQLAEAHRRPGFGDAYERRSFQGSEARQIADGSTAIADEALNMAHSSAPAESSFAALREGAVSGTPTAARGVDGDTASHSKLTVQKPQEAQVSQAEVQPALTAAPTPAQPVPARSPEHSRRGDDETEKKKAKFFLSTSVGRSFGSDDEDETPVTAAPRNADQGPVTQLSGGQASIQKETATVADTTVSESSSAKIQQNRSKSDVRQSSFGTGNRNRSGASLSKGKGRGGRIGSSGRLAAHGLTMTKAQAAAPPGPQPMAPSAALKPPTKPALVAVAKGTRPSRPVKFTMGSHDDDEDDFTDDSGEDEVKPPVNKAEAKTAAPTPASATTASQPTPAATHQQRGQEQAKPTDEVVQLDGDADDDEEGWSSDTSAEAEEERQRIEREVQRRRKAEQDHQRDMFKKIPVRSASAADVRHVAPVEQAVSPQSLTQPQAAAKGLLTSLFHPEEEPPHGAPGQLHGRPHASAANLREKPKRLSSTETVSKDVAGELSKSIGASSGRRPPRPPSFIAGITPSNREAGGPLRTSKSAVALPVLNTAAPKATALNELGLETHEDAGESGLLESTRSYVGLDKLGMASTMVDSPEIEASERQKSLGSGIRRPRSSMGPDRSAEHQGPTSHRLSLGQAVPTPAPGIHRAATAMAAPSLAPQSPRTTRRNMLRDELSESLRQNLLWERQSRNRMLGIGATAPLPPDEPRVQEREPPPLSSSMANPPSPRRPPHHRRETVLGNSSLKPLTPGNGHVPPPRHYDRETAAMPPPAPPKHYHHSRSTPHLNQIGATLGRSTTSTTAIEGDEGRGTPHHYASHHHQQHHQSQHHQHHKPQQYAQHHPQHYPGHPQQQQQHHYHAHPSQQQLHQHHYYAQGREHPPSSSAETSGDEDEEDGNNILQQRPPSHQRKGSDGHPTSRERQRDRSRDREWDSEGRGGLGEGPSGTGGGGPGGKKDKKKPMWTGGFPDYHQHGW